MSNGLGAGFFAITLLAVLAGLAVLITLLTVISIVFTRRRGHSPRLLGYLTVIVGIAVVAVAGFGILVLVDEAPAAAYLITLIVGIPLIVEYLYLVRRTSLPRCEAYTATLMAWCVPFFLGVIAVFAVMNGIESVFELAPAESRQLGVAWIAATIGGFVVILSMIPISNHLIDTLRWAEGSRV